MADVFTKIAALTELKGEGVFVVRAYQRVAHTIERLPVELEQYVAEGNNLREISGIGEAISKKIRELLETGRLEFYEELKAELAGGHPEWEQQGEVEASDFFRYLNTGPAF